MPHFNPLIDLPIMAAIWAAVLAGTLFWVFGTSQDKVERSREVISRTTFRITLLVAMFGAICWLVGVAFWAVIPIAMLIVLLGLGGVGAGPLAIPFVVFGMLIKDYVLGFPELILSPPTETRQKSSSQPCALTGATGTTLGPLAPQGDVSVEGDAYPAASANSTMIDPGKSVLVVGEKNGKLLVTEA